MMTLPRTPQRIRRTVTNIPYFVDLYIAKKAEKHSDQNKLASTGCLLDPKGPAMCAGQGANACVWKVRKIQTCVQRLAGTHTPTRHRV